MTVDLGVRHAFLLLGMGLGAVRRVSQGRCCWDCAVGLFAFLLKPVGVGLFCPLQAKA